MSVELGLKPDALRVHLTTGADFYTVIELEGDTWTVGETLTILFDDGTSWSATLSGADATWDVDKATADTIPHGTGARLNYTNGAGRDLTWNLGTVIRHG